MWLTVVNMGAVNAWLALGKPSATNTGIPLVANGGTTLLDMVNTPWYDSIYAHGTAATCQLVAQEVFRKL